MFKFRDIDTSSGTGCIILVFVFIIFAAFFSFLGCLFEYTLGAWFGKDVWFGFDIIAGVLLGWFVVPAAFITWLVDPKPK